MLNVAIRNLLILSASAVVVTSCGESADTKAARALLEQAKICLDEGNFTRSLELLDSIESAYPAEIAQRREGLHLRPKAIEGDISPTQSPSPSLSTIFFPLPRDGLY